MNDIKKQRIGIYGGRFNPVHTAHLVLAQTAIDKLSLDRVLFLPSSGRACYKDEGDVAPASHRLEMLRLAISENPQFELSAYEADREEFSYTVDTLRHFKKNDLAGSHIILLTGGDWISRIPTWKEGDQLLQEFDIAIFSRPGSKIVHDAEETPNPRVQYIEMPLLDISSSLIRQCIKDGQSISGLTPDQVQNYIEKHGLYR